MLFPDDPVHQQDRTVECLAEGLWGCVVGKVPPGHEGNPWAGGWHVTRIQERTLCQTGMPANATKRPILWKGLDNSLHFNIYDLNVLVDPPFSLSETINVPNHLYREYNVNYGDNQTSWIFYS